MVTKINAVMVTCIYFPASLSALSCNCDYVFKPCLAVNMVQPWFVLRDLYGDFKEEGIVFLGIDNRIF